MRRLLALLLCTGLLGGCATHGPQYTPGGPGLTPETAAMAASSDRGTDGDPPAIERSTATYDPWERFNRGMYRFNARFDESIHLPVARGYRRVVPQPVRSGVGNFFSNLGELGNTTNHLLQGRPGFAGRSSLRFLLNSTLGLAGLFDVADRMGLEAVPTSFGTTLGRWGVGPGPYLVLPVLGPSSLRDGIGQVAGFGLNRAVDLGGLYSSDGSLALGALLAVDVRANLSFRYYQSGSPFEYDMVRFLHTRQRAIEIEGAQALPSRPRPARNDEGDAEDPDSQPPSRENGTGLLLPSGLGVDPSP